MAKSADPDHDLDLHCLQRHGISRFSRTRVIIAFRDLLVMTTDKELVLSLSLSLLARLPSTVVSMSSFFKN